MNQGWLLFASTCALIPILSFPIQVLANALSSYFSRNIILKVLSSTAELHTVNLQSLLFNLIGLGIKHIDQHSMSTHY